MEKTHECKHNIYAKWELQALRDENLILCYPHNNQFLKICFDQGAEIINDHQTACGIKAENITLYRIIFEK